MFIEKQPQSQIDYYEKLLGTVGSFSKLFSEEPEPYLAYRVAENLFCRAFDAENLSRSDVSVDAAKNKIGIGIKTFLNGNGKSLQKVAEFNSDHFLFKNLSTERKIKKIAELRNDRLDTTRRIFKLDEIIYHCITREAGKMLIYEASSPNIDISKIKGITATPNIIKFSDSLAEYSFSVSKSTLYRRFITEKILLNVPVKIIDDPFVAIERLNETSKLIFSPIKANPHIFLPLYSIGKGGEKRVPDKSGLNQWNAAGRPRDPNEIYIPIPAWVNKKFPTFFPSRDVPFNLLLPNNETLSVKVCQDGSKALMSNPNSALGKWLLRSVLDLKERELLSYERLQSIGLDAVVVYKVDDKNYDIDFTAIGSYERFYSENE